MKDKDFHKLIGLNWTGAGWLNANENAIELSDGTKTNETVYFKEATQRDIKFHRCYFSLLNFIYGYMPNTFKNIISEDKFYIWLKHLKGNYEVLFEFKDGTKLVEYDSISFGRMSQKSFENYIRELLPWIYENVLGKYFEPKMLCSIVNTIEEEYKKFLSKL
jgi:hypothetical protein